MTYKQNLFLNNNWLMSGVIEYVKENVKPMFHYETSALRL